MVLTVLLIKTAKDQPNSRPNRSFRLMTLAVELLQNKSRTDENWERTYEMYKITGLFDRWFLKLVRQAAQSPP